MGVADSHRRPIVFKIFIFIVQKFNIFKYNPYSIYNEFFTYSVHFLYTNITELFLHAYFF